MRGLGNSLTRSPSSPPSLSQSTCATLSPTLQSLLALLTSSNVKKFFHSRAQALISLSDLAVVCRLASVLQAPGHLWRQPCASKSDCIKHGSLLVSLGAPPRASSSSGLRSRHSPTGRTVVSCRWPSRSHCQTGTLMISSLLVHLSDTGSLRIDRTVIASPFAIKMYSLDCIKTPTNMPDSTLSSAFVRSVNGPTRYHTRSPNTHLPMWCPRRRHRANGTFPSHATVSRFINVAACPNTLAVVFDSSGICIWQLNSSSFLSVLTTSPTNSHCSLGQSISKVITWCRRFPRWLQILPFYTSYCSGDLHHSSFSVAAHGHLCRSQHVHPIQRSFTTACGSTAPFLNGQTKDRSSILPDPNGCGISAQIPMINAHTRTLIIVPWMLMMSTFDTAASYTLVCTDPSTACRTRMALPLGFRGCAKPRHQPDTFSVLSIILAIHVWLFLCTWSDFAFLLGILHSSRTKISHFALTIQAFSRVLWSVLHLSGTILDSRLAGELGSSLIASFLTQRSMTNSSPAFRRRITSHLGLTVLVSLLSNCARFPCCDHLGR